jgi:hypothetical protein
MQRFENLTSRLTAILLAAAPLVPACGDRCEGKTKTASATVKRDDRHNDPSEGPTRVVKCEQGENQSCQMVCAGVYTDRYKEGLIKIDHCQVDFDDAGAEVVVAAHDVSNCQHGGVVEGRRPPGLLPPELLPGGANTATGIWLAAMARLEEASIYAFEQLAGELRYHRAPHHLIVAALEAAGDEVRHARVLARFSAAYGTIPARARIARRAVPRALTTIAVDNAIEGCVRECFGALVALHQSRCAADRQVRAAMTAIARDEIRHAELAMEIDAWLRERQPTVGAVIDLAKRTAVARLRSELNGHVPPAAVRCALGLPDPATTFALFKEARRVLWSC